MLHVRVLGMQWIRFRQRLMLRQRVIGVGGRSFDGDDSSGDRSVVVATGRPDVYLHDESSADPPFHCTFAHNVQNGSSLTNATLQCVKLTPEEPMLLINNHKTVREGG